MAITSIDGYIAASKQRIEMQRQQTRTTSANQYYSLRDLAGTPGAIASLSAGNTANGVVPTDNTALGFPTINAFGGGATGYISRVLSQNTAAGRFFVSDLLFYVGAISAVANTAALASQPSFAARVPGADYKGLEMWVEGVVLISGGTCTLEVTYTNQDGTTGRTTGVQNGYLSGLVVGFRKQLPLQSGDTGVQKIESVIVTGVATLGSFNVGIVRPLFNARIPAGNFGDVADLIKTGMPVVYADSALDVMYQTDGSSTGVPELSIEIANA